MSLGAAVALLILAMMVFGSGAIVDLIQKIRHSKKGDAIIREPWVEIHEIPGYHDSRKIAAFYPMKGEPNIMPILEELALEGRLLLPRCTGESAMEFYPISDIKKDLEPGAFGIMEPKKSIEAWNGEIPVFLVPGTKFNWNGFRKGHGKGYYDRYLAKHPNSFKAGIATPQQITDVPLEQKPTDVKMHTVIACREKY